MCISRMENSFPGRVPTPDRCGDCYSLFAVIHLVYVYFYYFSAADTHSSIFRYPLIVQKSAEAVFPQESRGFLENPTRLSTSRRSFSGFLGMESDYNSMRSQIFIFLRKLNSKT